MSIYPSLEDMKIDHLSQAQYQLESEHYRTTPQAPVSYHSALLYPSLNDPAPVYPSSAASAALPYPVSPVSAVVYPSLSDYMGLELTPEVIAANMPEYIGTVAIQPQRQVVQPNSGMVAPISSLTPGLQRAQVTNGIRELVLCKDGQGKVGVRVAAVNKGVFVCLVTSGSPAAIAGLRFGDQLLQINGQSLAGYSRDQVHDLFKKCSVNGISVIVRDRPFERTITLHKDSVGQIGFQFKNGQIFRLVKDSSAARNGVLVDHQILEVDGCNVVGKEDKEIGKIINQTGTVVTITVMPTFVYEHMMKKMATNLVKASMDHSIPTL